MTLTLWIALTAIVNIHSSDAYKKDWADPHDMGIKVTAIKNEPSVEKNVTNAQLSGIQFERFYKRHVNKLLKSLFNGDFQRTSLLTSWDISCLKELKDLMENATFSKKLKVLHGVEAALDKLMSHISLEDFLQDAEPELNKWTMTMVHWLETNFFIVPFVIAVFLLTCWQLGVSLRTLFVSIFFISCGWEWSLMYKQVIAQKYEALAANGGNPPEYCDPKQRSFLQSLIFGYSHKKECMRYQELLTVDAYLEVNPSIAISQTMSRLVFHPLLILGEKLGEFFGSVLASNSYLASTGVLICSCLFLIILVIVSSGYTIRLPYFLGSLEPNSARHQNSIQSLTQEIGDLKLLVKQLSNTVREIKPEEHQVCKPLTRTPVPSNDILQPKIQEILCTNDTIETVTDEAANIDTQVKK